MPIYRVQRVADGRLISPWGLGGGRFNRVIDRERSGARNMCSAPRESAQGRLLADRGKSAFVSSERCPPPCACTLSFEQLRRTRPLCWPVCTVSFVPLIIQWGPDTSSSKLRRSAQLAPAGLLATRGSSGSPPQRLRRR